MEWWSKYCYVCFNKFDSKDVPRLLPYCCNHDICEHCFMELTNYNNLKDKCSVCKASHSFDIRSRVNAYYIADEQSLLTRDICQKILLHKEFPYKLGKFINPSEYTIFNKIKKYFRRK